MHPNVFHNPKETVSKPPLKSTLYAVFRKSRTNGIMVYKNTYICTYTYITTTLSSLHQIPETKCLFLGVLFACDKERGETPQVDEVQKKVNIKCFFHWRISTSPTGFRVLLNSSKLFPYHSTMKCVVVSP